MVADGKIKLYCVRFLKKNKTGNSPRRQVSPILRPYIFDFYLINLLLIFTHLVSLKLKHIFTLLSEMILADFHTILLLLSSFFETDLTNRSNPEFMESCQLQLSLRLNAHVVSSPMTHNLEILLIQVQLSVLEYRLNPKLRSSVTHRDKLVTIMIMISGILTGVLPEVIVMKMVILVINTKSKLQSSDIHRCRFIGIMMVAMM